VTLLTFRTRFQEKIVRLLGRINPSAARSLEDGLEETLTVHRLGLRVLLRRKMATTKPIESRLPTVQRVARNVGGMSH
jgi:putative transposase